MAEPDKIEWTKDYLLKWSDYTAEQNPAKYHPAKTAIEYSAIWKVNWHESNGKITYSIGDIQLVTEFHKQRSWVRQQEIQDEIQSQIILKHEQGHFDLAERLRSKITKNIQDAFSGKLFPVFGKDDVHAKDFVLKDSKERVETELEKQNNEIFKKEEKYYDEETKYGFNKDSQEKFNDEFAKLRK